MHILAQQMDANTSDLCEAALHSWTLLLSSIPARRARPVFHAMQGKLQKLLAASDVDVRLAASEALAVLVESCRTADEVLILYMYSQSNCDIGGGGVLGFIQFIHCVC